MRQRLLPRTIANVSNLDWFRLFCASLSLAVAGCMLEDSGTQPSGTDTPSTTNSSSSSSSSTSSTSGTSSASSTSSGSAGQGGAGGTGGAGGAGGGPTKDFPRTCKEVLKTQPNAPMGDYTVDPDGAMGNDPFTVTCKKIGNDLWTLVGLEKPQSTENLKLLGVENGSPEALIMKDNAMIGIRFRKLYTAVRIEWDAARYIEFQVGNSEIFEDAVQLALPITAFKSSETNLQDWVMGGAKFCRAASKKENKFPGDTSWAVKPMSDMNNVCGCNSMGWAGQGAFYGGTKNGCDNPCNCYGGGFAGAKDNGQAKGGIVSNTETRIYVL